MEHESFLQIGTDIMIPRCAYNKPVIVKFPNKCEWQNRFNPDNEGAWSCIWMGLIQTQALVLGCINGDREGVITFAFGSTAWYSWLKYTLLRCAYWKI
jgi:hypothetical protein